MDSIFIRDLRVDALIGFHKRERYAPQTLTFDVEIGIANEAVFASDRVADCIDYDKVAARVREIATGHHYNLVEALADRVARAIIAEFQAASVTVSVAKLGVLRGAGLVGVRIERRAP
ncbi:MAG TPA: dihydroneopterin aldolase [Burkholderiales bacterium]|nr:dihydroneopterin aldolase [Burkholderiales bacterium]